jgi:hypothetical protein
MRPEVQPQQSLAGLQAWQGSMLQAGAIMRRQGTVIDVEDAAALHVSLEYVPVYF